MKIHYHLEFLSSVSLLDYPSRPQNIMFYTFSLCQGRLPWASQAMTQIEDNPRDAGESSFQDFWDALQVACVFCKHCAGPITTLFFQAVSSSLSNQSGCITLFFKILYYEYRHTYRQKGLLVKHEPLTVNSILALVKDSNQFLNIHTSLSFHPCPLKPYDSLISWSYLFHLDFNI